MSLWMIAWRSIQQRGLASTLTSLSMALGVMLVVVVITVHGVISESFARNARLGYNMIVGAKGGPLQLTLNTVYYLSQPVENIPYTYYMEFLPAERRQAEWRQSLAFRQHQLRRASAAAAPLGATLGGVSAAAAQLANEALARAEAERLDFQRAGRFSPFVDLVIPVCLGDYFGHFRVVGTTPAFFDELVYDLENNRKYEFAEGRNFRHFDREHGYFEAVVGATVAREMKLRLGDAIAPSHGVPTGHEHERRFTVVGILKPSGTPNDRAVFINMEGFYLMEDHAKPLPRDESEEPELFAPPEPTAAGDSLAPLPVEQREVTALLVRVKNPLFTPGLQNMINEGRDAQAVLPVQQIYSLLTMIVGPIQTALLVLTVMICIVSGVSILVSIYNSMSDRRHEIAVMRALGAGRTTVMTVILLESMMLSLGGGLLGWIAAHVASAIASPWVEQMTGVTIGLLDLAPPVDLLGIGLKLYPELILIPGLMALAIAVGLMPAVAAYRTDVARSLAP